MRVIFISFKSFISDYSRKMHVDAVRINEYYNNFKKIYKIVDFFYINDDGFLSNGISTLELDEKILDNYDIVFFYHEATIEKIIKKNGKIKTLNFISKKPSFIQLDCSIWSFTKDDDIMSKFKSIGISHPGAYNQIKHIDKNLIYNASIDRLSPVNINNTGDIIYIGRVERVKTKLINLSKVLKTNINLYTFDECGKELDREEFITFKGDLKYNEIGEALNGCRYGLCFYNNESPCGKIFDYLSYGVPVLYEFKIGENNLIKESRLGESFDYDNLESISFKEYNFKSDYIFENINKNHLWVNRVKIWEHIIKKYQ